jgi:YgiT-type zinc finger domain-containing protein
MGRLNRRFVTYITWLGDEMITVPDFPAWVCDVCGSRIYDGNAVNRLSLLLSPNAGHPVRRAGSSLVKHARVKKSPGTRPE